MAGLNKILIIGHLGRNPELKYGQASGKAVCKFSLAVSERRGEDEQTEWFNVVCFGNTAEAVNTYLAKGSLAGVEGRLQTRKYQDRDGYDRRITEVLADRVVFLGSGGNGKSPEKGLEDRKSDDRPTARPGHQPDRDDPFSGDFGPPPTEDDMPF